MGAEAVAVTMTTIGTVDVRILPFAVESESAPPCAGAMVRVGLCTEDGAELDEPDEPAESAGLAGAAEPQLPENVFPFFVPTVVTSGPGLGKKTSVSSVVVQPFPMLALKMSGRWAKGIAGAGPLPDEIVTEAQFIYISRFPVWFHQSQAKTAAPVSASEGTLNLKLPPVEVGHAPWYEWMTFHVFPPS